MAITQIPLANTSLAHLPGGYDQNPYNQPFVAVAQVGSPVAGDGGAASGNGAYVLYTAFANSNVYQTNFTVVTPGTGTGNVTVYKVSANNGVNVSSNVAIGNVVVFATNVAGNVFTTGPYTYNVNSAINLSASSSNTTFAGGISLNVGDVIMAVSTGNTGILAAATQYSFNPQSANTFIA